MSKPKTVGGEPLVCGICGRGFLRLDTHVRSAHGIDAADYRSRFGDVPLVSPSVTRAVHETVTSDIPAALRAAGWETIAEAVEWAQREQVGWAALERRTGIPYPRLRRWGRAHGAPDLPRRHGRQRGAAHSGGPPPGPRKRDLTEAEAEELRAAWGALAETVQRMRSGGVRAESIASTLGRSESWVATHFPMPRSKA